MKGVILAGGAGTRLAPCTQVTNKHLLPVYDKPMIFYPINTLVENGITDIMIVCGRGSAGAFMDLLGSGEEYGCNFYFSVQDTNDGIAGGLKGISSFLEGHKVAVILGDNIFNGVKIDDITAGCRLYLYEHDFPERFGVVKISGKVITGIEEKPKNPPSNFVVTGLYVYDDTLVEKLGRIEKSERGEYEITDVNNLYVKKKKAHYSHVPVWHDAGTFKSLREASEYMFRRKK